MTDAVSWERRERCGPASVCCWSSTLLAISLMVRSATTFNYLATTTLTGRMLEWQVKLRFDLSTSSCKPHIPAIVTMKRDVCAHIWPLICMIACAGRSFPASCACEGRILGRIWLHGIATRSSLAHLPPADDVTSCGMGPGSLRARFYDIMRPDRCFACCL